MVGVAVLVVRNFTERRDRHRLGRHHAAQTVAGRAGGTQLSGQKIFADALARVNSSRPSGENDWDRRPRAIFAQAVFEGLDDLVAVAFRRHVDEVADNDSADVAQADLACDLRRSFDVRLDDRIVEVLAAGEFTRVDVDHRQRFGRLDDDRTSRGQLRGRLHQLGDFLVDMEVGEERRTGRIRLDPLDVLRTQQAHEIPHAFGFIRIVDPDVLNLGSDEIARRLVHEVHVFVQERRRRGGLVVLEDAVPHADQHAEVGDQLGVRDAAGGGAHDRCHPFGPDRLPSSVLEPVALFGRFDLLRETPEYLPVGIRIR